MYNFLLKRGLMVAFLVGALIVVVHLVLSGSGGYDFGLYASMGLAIIAGIAMLVGVTKYFIENPSQIKIALGFIGLFVVLGVLVTMASGDIPRNLAASAADKDVTSGIFKYISGAINGTVLLLGVATLGLIVSEVLSLFK